MCIELSDAEEISCPVCNREQLAEYAFQRVLGYNENFRCCFCHAEWSLMLPMPADSSDNEA